MKIGITERGDAGIDFSWADKLCEGNILITKQLHTKNDKLIDLLLQNKDKVILHVTCTGYGGTKIEPHVPKPEDVKMGVYKLLREGFPVEQIVLRTDPIIPTQTGISIVKAVWDLFKDTGITRVRYSVIDMYPHVRERFTANGIGLPFSTFLAPKAMMDAVKEAVTTYDGPYGFEACAENLPVQTGCISKKDLELLGLPTEEAVGGFQRKGCLCLAGKTELLTNKRRCPSGCLYCYWKDNK